MINILRPILELSVVIPGLLLAYFPVKSGLKQLPGKLALWQGPLVLSLCIGGGIFCWHFQSASDLHLEIRNDRTFCLCIVCLYEQSGQSSQCGYSDPETDGAATAMVLPVGMCLLSWNLLAYDGSCVLSGYQCGTYNGGR